LEGPDCYIQGCINTFFDLLSDLERKYWRPIDIEPPDANLYIPIWGNVKITSPLSYIYFLPIVQRLSEIKQLALTDSKYPGGNHTRLEHSLGVLSIARLIINNMLSLNNEEKSIIELGMLLHDIGHGGWGHSLDGLHGYIMGLLKDDPDIKKLLPIDKLDVVVAWYLLRNNDQIRSGLRRVAEKLDTKLPKDARKLKMKPEDLEKAISLIIAEEPGLVKEIGQNIEDMEQKKYTHALRQAVLYGQTILGEPRGVGGVNADRIDWILRDTLHLFGYIKPLPPPLEDLEGKLEILQTYSSNIGEFLGSFGKGLYKIKYKIGNKTIEESYEIIQVKNEDLLKKRDKLRDALYKNVYESESKAFGDSVLLRLAFCAAKTLEVVGREVSSPSIYSRVILGYILQPDHLLRESTKKILSAASEALHAEDPMKEYIQKGYDLAGLLDILPSIVHAVGEESNHEDIHIVSRIPYPHPNTYLLAFILNGKVLFEGIEELLPDLEDRLIAIQKLATYAHMDPITTLDIPSVEAGLDKKFNKKHPGILSFYVLVDHYLFRELYSEITKLIGSDIPEGDLNKELNKILERYNERYFLRILIRCRRKEEISEDTMKELAREVRDFVKGRFSASIKNLYVDLQKLQKFAES
jgi:hypothetical protein